MSGRWGEDGGVIEGETTGSTRGRRRALAAGIVLAAGFTSPVASAWTLARDGEARTGIVIARDATAAERNAADELAAYLGRSTGGAFDIVVEGESSNGSQRRVFVGPTRAAERAGISAETLGPEEWVIRTTHDGLVLCGGRPRGTLYAAYHFLEDHVGVRWWSQYEEFVPRLRSLSLGTIDRRGTPAFAYREVSLLEGTFPFCVRNRLNGHLTRIPATWGDHVGYATPWFVHSFDYLVPPDRFFASHPEYFAERAGFRVGSRTQLCLSEPAVAQLIAGRLVEIAERERDRSLQSGSRARTLYDVSHNDWGGWCRCARCEGVKAREGADSGVLLPVVNRAAEAVASVDPEARVTTLAYTFTFRPPEHARARDNVIVVVTGWGKRDFGRPAEDPANAYFRGTVQRWSEIAKHVWVWDYAFSMGASELGLPFPTYRNYARDLRWYRSSGVDGMIVQSAWEVPGDLRDLNVWMLVKLLEDPDRDDRALLADFLHGYYGPAASALQRYLRLLESATRTPPVLAAETTVNAYTFLDERFLTVAQRIFDDAERRVAHDDVLARRVRHARVSLDYATLLRWPDLLRRRFAEGRGAAPPAIDRAAVAARFERTCREQIALRVPEHRRDAEWRRIWESREDRAP